jgi:hypothetical protein
MRNIILIIALIYLNGCSRTIKTWEQNSIKEYLEIYGKDDLPLKLQEKGVEYKCVDLIYSSEGNTKKCYVLKNSSEKIDGWVSRLYKTSKAVLLDTGENIMVVGMLSLCIMIGGDCSKINLSTVNRDGTL